MASLPSAAVANTNTLKLDPQFKKLKPNAAPFEKRNYSPKELDRGCNPFSLDFREALSLIEEGDRVIESSFYVPLLQECVEKKWVSALQSIHAHIMKTGVWQDLFVMTFLVNTYAKCGEMDTARMVFDLLPRRNVVTWTSLMSGYVGNSQPQVAVCVFKEMLEVGGYPTSHTLAIVLNACSLLSDVELGKQIHGYVVKYRVEYDTSTGNALCNLYSVCGCLDSAVKAFLRIEEKNVISWTSVISACGDNGNSAMGLDLFVKMLIEDVKPNEFTLTSVLSLCCIMQALEVGTQVHSMSIKLGYGSNLPVRNSIMYLYLKSSCIKEAEKLLDGSNTISLVTWNAMIAGHAQIMDLAEDTISAHHSGNEALRIFQRMNRSGIKPDLYTFSSVLTVCSSLVALEQGEQVHAQTLKVGYLSDVVVGTALVNMYRKCGNIDRASKAFIEMSLRTLISWTSMITAFAQHGRSKHALQLFEDMRFVGVKPNKITFVGVLSACSQAGMVDEALAYFDMMKNEYKLKPLMDHYTCLIDMFVRLGNIDEAFDFLNQMDFAPNEIIWLMLVSGCTKHGNTELALYAAEQLLTLKPKDSETYLLLINTYCAAEKWQDVSRVRQIMTDERITIPKDWSWITIRNRIFAFEPDYSQTHKSGEIAKLLEELHEKARSLGYQLETNLKLSDKDEQTPASSAHHSERLAIAFALLNTPNAAQIRVVKSTSMCRDCHNFVKFTSVLTSRTIVVRDSKRLHIFENGSCSCGDFGSLL